MRQGEPGQPSQLDQDDVDGEDDGDGDDVDNEGEVGNYFLLFSAETMPDNKVASLRGTAALSVGAVDKQNYILIMLVMLVMMVRITRPSKMEVYHRGLWEHKWLQMATWNDLNKWI